MRYLINTQEQPSAARNIWEDCSKIIKLEIKEQPFVTWFSPVKPVELTADKIILQIPNIYFAEWIDSKYKSLIHRALKQTTGLDLKYEFRVVEEDFGNPDIPEPPVELKIKSAPIKTSPQVPNGLNPKYTFDNFIKGESNELAFSAAHAITQNPGKNPFNPFFIYGGVGLGKTHLIHALGNKIAIDFPEKKVIYLSTDVFTQEFFDSIRDNKINEFSAFYRKMDVLIIDDIQFLKNKEKTQDLFFNIFNILHQHNKQIVLSSDKPPKELQGMEDRLISRFNWGLTADIQPPAYEMRIAILYKKAEDIGITISHEIMDYIASNITSNIRELESCLIKLLANSALNFKEIDLNLAKSTVREISTAKRVAVNIDVITKITSDHLNIDEKKIRDKTRKQEIVNARQISMYLSKEMTKLSLKNIGLHFGGRDHSTVIHACDSVKKQILNDEGFKKTVEDIKYKIELTCG